MRSGWRLAGVGALFVALFIILALRLWYLQVSAAEVFGASAEEQQLQVVSVPAPRGDIFDSEGRKLAGTVASLSLVVDRSLVSADREEDLIQHLAALINRPASEIRAQFEKAGTGARFPIELDVSQAAALYALEHAEQFPGVVVEPIPVRVYPEGESAAHVVGYMGAPDEDDLKRPDIKPNDEVGKFGIEREYDALLRGTPGRVIYRVNAKGEILEVVDELLPVPGGTAVLTIDLELQSVLEEALAAGIRLAAEEGEPVVRASGLVLDPRDGSVRAMASIPAFDPGVFITGLSDTEWEALQEKEALSNFAIQGRYPPASAFKVVAYTLALEKGIFPDEVTDPESLYFCRGRLEFEFRDGSPNVYTDWLVHGHGEVNVHGALQQSCDLYFWEIALKIWRGRGDQYDEALVQEWARQLGFGAETGIDLPFEQAGLVADREWFERVQEEQPGRVRPKEEGGWSGGDVMNIVIGQGLVLTTPLQLANGYAALVNGGTVWEPRILDRVKDANNETVYTNPASVTRKIDLSRLTV
ncbi:MAG: penicillin-binding transpeptidase domain-containing protein, partial [Acidimicrobiia bacterium]